MEIKLGDYLISNDKTLMQRDRIKAMLVQTYWASWYPEEYWDKIIASSHCYGVFNEQSVQVGFARVITDFCLTYYLADVVIDVSLRGQGLGKALIDFVVHDPLLKGCSGHLRTENAYSLYEKYGFIRDFTKSMYRSRDLN